MDGQLLFSRKAFKYIQISFAFLFFSILIGGYSYFFGSTHDYLSDQEYLDTNIKLNVTEIIKSIPFSEIIKTENEELEHYIKKIYNKDIIYKELNNFLISVENKNNYLKKITLKNKETDEIIQFELSELNL